jgi:predicted MFS family arabinose efflux permease
MLIVGAVLMLVAGVFFAITNNFTLLLIAAIIGVIAPNGNEVGPFLSIELSSLSQIVPEGQRTKAFAWYDLLGSVATASGGIAGGWLAQILQDGRATPFESYRSIAVSYAVFGAVMILLFLMLSPSVGVNDSESAVKKDMFGLHRSKSIVLRLSLLFSLDAFGGGFIVQSILVYWFFVRFRT